MIARSSMPMIIAATIAAGAAQAETLTVAHGFSPNHVNYTLGLEPWMACVSEATGGEIEFNDFPSGQISGHGNSIDALTGGLTQVTSIPPGYETGKVPLNSIPILPGMGESVVEMVEANREMLGNGSPIAEEWASLGIVPLISMFTPPYQIMSTGEALDSLEKMRGKKIRAVAGPQSQAMQALGAVPVEMSAGDMYVALQRGTIDATILSLTSASAYGLLELLASSSSNGAFAGGQSIWAISQEALESMPAETQDALIDCGLRVEGEAARRLDEMDELAQAEFAEQGIEVFDFSEAASAEFEDALSGVSDNFVAGLEARGLPAREAFDMYRGALDD